MRKTGMVVVLLSSAVMFSSSAFAFTADQKNIYSGVINNFQSVYGDNATFCEVNFNNDDIPELVVQYGTMTADIQSEVFTIVNGTCVSAGTFPCPANYFGIEDGEGIYSVFSHQGLEKIYEVHMPGNAVTYQEIGTREVLNGETPFTTELPIYRKPVSHFYSEQIIEGSDSRYLTQSDLNNFSKTGLELAKNEIYARRGRIFVTPYIDKYFRQQSWYQPTIAPESFSDNMLNEYETANVALIVNAEGTLAASGDSYYYAPEGGSVDSGSSLGTVTLRNGNVATVIEQSPSDLVKMTNITCVLDGSLFADGMPVETTRCSLLEDHGGDMYAIGYLADNSYLDQSFISQFSAKGACFAKNEIYARHGRRFNSQELQNFFDSMHWYEGNVNPENFSDSVFNEYEIANIQALTDYENQIGAYNPQ